MSTSSGEDSASGRVLGDEGVLVNIAVAVDVLVSVAMADAVFDRVLIGVSLAAGAVNDGMLVSVAVLVGVLVADAVFDGVLIGVSLVADSVIDGALVNVMIVADASTDAATASFRNAVDPAMTMIRPNSNIIAIKNKFFRFIACSPLLKFSAS